MSNEAATQLKELPLFAEFTEAELEAFVELIDPVSFKADALIVRQDEPGDCMYLIIDGAAKVTHHRGDQSFELATLRRGDFFGELALIDQGPRSCDVCAVEDCVVLKIPQSVVRALAGVYPSAAFKFLVGVGRAMVTRIRRGLQKYIDSLLLVQQAANR